MDVLEAFVENEKILLEIKQQPMHMDFFKVLFMSEQEISIQVRILELMLKLDVFNHSSKPLTKFI